MSAILKSCNRLASSLKLHILHDIRSSHITNSASKHIANSRCNPRPNLNHRTTLYEYSTQSKAAQKEEDDEKTDDEEYEDEEDEEEEQEDDKRVEAKTDDDADEEVEDEDEDDADLDEAAPPPKELTESQKFLIQYRKSQGIQYTPRDDSDFVYKPIPRMPGPSPFVNHDYRRKSVAVYGGIEKLQLPVSSVMPLGGTPEIWIHSSNASKKAIYKLSPDLFNQDIRIDILWRCVRYERHKYIHWTWSIVKHRGEIRGSGKKKRPQKGSGKARMGDMKAPQCRGGGKAHGRRPKSVETGLKKYIYQKGIKIALTARYQEGDLYVWEDFALPRMDKPDYLKSMELYEAEQVNKHPELGDELVPIEELDWNDNTKLYYDVYRTRQMLNKWGWLKPQLYERCNNNKVFNKIMNAKKTGNIVDILEAMPIADFQWDFLKEEDELVDHTIPTVLMIHDGYLHDDFVQAINRVSGVHLMCWDEIYGETSNDGKRHTPKMGINRLLKYKKIVFSVNALKRLEQQIGIEAEVERWNYYADLNRIRQSEEARDAFPESN